MQGAKSAGYEAHGYDALHSQLTPLSDHSHIQLAMKCMYEMALFYSHCVPGRSLPAMKCTDVMRFIASWLCSGAAS